VSGDRRASAWVGAFFLARTRFLPRITLARRQFEGVWVKLANMVRLSLSFVLATGLILSGVALQAVAISDTSPLKYADSILAIASGVVWLWRIIKEWRAR
jgi:hypothetical protein